jgi:hypothetical protein
MEIPTPVDDRRVRAEAGSRAGAAHHQQLLAALAATAGEPSELVADLRGTSDSGIIATGGLLGFHDGLVNQPMCRRRLDGCFIISAPAPSQIRLTLRQPAVVFGFLNAGCTLDRSKPVAFWANGNYVGHAVAPSDHTRELQLPAGPCLLQATCDGSPSPGRHSGWALKVDERRRADPVAVECATPDNTVVMCIASYPAEDMPAALSDFAGSARKHDIWLEVRGVGETYGHVRSKVVRMRQWIRRLPPHVRYVLYVDATDTLFTRPLAAICLRFNELASPIVIGAEAICYPVLDPRWRERFPSHAHGRRWLNAGMWMGERGALLGALDELVKLNDEFQQPAPTPRLADVWEWREWFDDDQFLWQVAALKNIIPLHLDRASQLFLNVASVDPRLTGNSDCDLDPANGIVTVRATGGQPAVLHFSGSANAHCKQQWGGYLGLFTE